MAIQLSINLKTYFTRQFELLCLIFIHFRLALVQALSEWQMFELSQANV